VFFMYCDGGSFAGDVWVQGQSGQALVTYMQVDRICFHVNQIVEHNITYQPPFLSKAPTALRTKQSVLVNTPLASRDSDTIK
jgi:hypothetical protein